MNKPTHEFNHNSLEVTNLPTDDQKNPNFIGRRIANASIPDIHLRPVSGAVIFKNQLNKRENGKPAIKHSNTSAVLFSILSTSDKPERFHSDVKQVPENITREITPIQKQFIRKKEIYQGLKSMANGLLERSNALTTFQKPRQSLPGLYIKKSQTISENKEIFIGHSTQSVSPMKKQGQIISKCRSDMNYLRKNLKVPCSNLSILDFWSDSMKNDASKYISKPKNKIALKYRSQSIAPNKIEHDFSITTSIKSKEMPSNNSSPQKLTGLSMIIEACNNTLSETSQIKTKLESRYIKMRKTLSFKLIDT